MVLQMYRKQFHIIKCYITVFFIDITMNNYNLPRSLKGAVHTYVCTLYRRYVHTYTAKHLHLVFSYKHFGINDIYNLVRIRPRPSCCRGRQPITKDYLQIYPAEHGDVAPLYWCIGKPTVFGHSNQFSDLGQTDGSKGDKHQATIYCGGYMVILPHFYYGHGRTNILCPNRLPSPELDNKTKAISPVKGNFPLTKKKKTVFFNKF